MLPGRNLEALQSIGLKGMNGGEKTNTRGGRERERGWVKGENAQEHEDTKRREHREASRGGG